VDADQVVDDRRFDRRERVVAAKSGVVDEQRQALVFGDPLFDPRQPVAVGEIGGEDLGPGAALLKEPLRQRLHSVAAARDEDKVIAFAGQALGKRDPDTGGSARHQRLGAARVGRRHVILLPRSAFFGAQSSR
jgi:hypothetical protein